MGGGNDNKGDDDSGTDDDEDMDLTSFDHIAAFADPVERKQKKGLDFSKWRELVPHDNSHDPAEKKDRESLAEVKKQNNKGKTTESTGKRNMSSYAALAHADVPNPKEMNVQSRFYSVDDMDLDKFNPVPDIARAQPELLEHMTPRLEVKESQALENMEELETPHMVPGSNNFGIDQEPVTLESQIDAENRARLERMSTEEIAEAQAEIMQKMNPALLKVLKKRGLDKLKKQKGPGFDIAINDKLHNLQDESQLKQDTKHFLLMENDNSHKLTATASKDTQKEQDVVSLQNSGPGNSNSWNTWSERVEAARELRFSWDGTVIENDFVQVSGTGKAVDNSLLHFTTDLLIQIFCFFKAIVCCSLYILKKLFLPNSGFWRSIIDYFSYMGLL